LNKLTPQHVQALYARKLAEGLSPTTVHHIHEVFHAALQGALRLNLVLRNVSDLVDPPRMTRRTLTTLTEQQAQQLVASVAGTRWEALYVLALTTGMRMGELLALRWSDINLADGSLQIHSTLFFDAGAPYFSEPKTAHSRRRIALGRRAVDALARHRELIKLEEMQAAARWTDLNLVFPDCQGRPINGKNLLRAYFRPHLAHAGLPLIRFHDLRHTAATLLLGRGVNPKVVSEMLGHSTIAITLDIYSHVVPHMQQQAASIMDDVLGGD
jgi:integrase